LPERYDDNRLKPRTGARRSCAGVRMLDDQFFHH
jgi:hypothetical protein